MSRTFFSKYIFTEYGTAHQNYLYLFILLVKHLMLLFQKQLHLRASANRIGNNYCINKDIHLLNNVFLRFFYNCEMQSLCCSYDCWVKYKPWTDFIINEQCAAFFVWKKNATIHYIKLFLFNPSYTLLNGHIYSF